jgi:hypothetical protein
MDGWVWMKSDDVPILECSTILSEISLIFSLTNTLLYLSV